MLGDQEFASAIQPTDFRLQIHAERLHQAGVRRDCIDRFGLGVRAFQWVELQGGGRLLQ